MRLRTGHEATYELEQAPYLPSPKGASLRGHCRRAKLGSSLERFRYMTPVDYKRVYVTSNWNELIIMDPLSLIVYLWPGLQAYACASDERVHRLPGRVF